MYAALLEHADLARFDRLAEKEGDPVLGSRGPVSKVRRLLGGPETAVYRAIVFASW